MTATREGSGAERRDVIVQTLDARKSYARGAQQVDALRGVSVDIARGELVAIVGPSGSGKSTLLHLLGGLDRPTSGSVRLAGEPIESYSDDRLSAFRRRRLGFIFQFFNLLPTLSAEENVMLPLLLDGVAPGKVAPKARELLALMGLEKRRTHRPDQLSGGEMQRVAIARALVADPLLVLADEPTGNLDTKTGASVLELLRRLVKDRNQALVMVTHDAKAASFADRIVALRDGVVESDAPPERDAAFESLSA
jgi:putative ABC transport system ATP-binding protein